LSNASKPPDQNDRIEAIVARAAEIFRREVEELFRLVAKYPAEAEQALRDVGFELPLPNAAPSAATEPPPPAPTQPKRLFDGTLGGLIAVYRTHPEAGRERLHYQVRQRHDQMFRQITETYGDTQLFDIKASTLTSWYETQRGDDDKLASAHAMIARIKAVLVFGVKVLEDPECIRLLAIARAMRFETPKARAEQLTREQAIAIRKVARDVGKPSIALAQAFQSDLGLMQKDAIGEWLPLSEAGTSDITYGNEKWLRGLRWSNIESGRVKFTTGAYGKGKPKQIDVPLKELPMVMEELAIMAERDPNNKRIGPLIICEATDRPWAAGEFRRWWRKIADMAGVPANVKNADTRPRETAARHAS